MSKLTWPGKKQAAISLYLCVCVARTQLISQKASDEIYLPIISLVSNRIHSLWRLVEIPCRGLGLNEGCFWLVGEEMEEY